MRFRCAFFALVLALAAVAGCAQAGVVQYGDVQYVFADAREGAATLTLALSGERVDARTLQKQTLPALEGAEFGVFARGADGALVPFPDPSNPSRALTFTTGADAAQINLPLSVELWLCQLSAPEGYEPALREPLRLSLPCALSLSCRKMDDQGVRVQLTGDSPDGPVPLAGVSFQVEGAEGSFEIVTDENGVALRTELPQGEYALRQQGAPAPYTVDEAELAFTVETGRLAGVEIVNSLPGTLTLRVLGLAPDAQTGGARLVPLAREYAVRDAGGALLGTLANGETMTLPASQAGTRYQLEACGAADDGFADDPVVREALVFSGAACQAQAVLESDGGFFTFEHACDGAAQAVPGGVFALYDGNGALALRFTPGTDGRFASASPLPAGEYTLRMLEAAEGYPYSAEAVRMTLPRYLAAKEKAEITFTSEPLPDALTHPRVTCETAERDSLFAEDAQVAFTLRAWTEQPALVVTEPVYEIEWPSLAGLTVEDAGADGRGAFTLARRFALPGVVETAEVALRGTVSYSFTYATDGEGGVKTVDVREPFTAVAARFAPYDGAEYAVWGRLTDASGAALPGRRASLLDADGNERESVQTDPFGAYAFETASDGAKVSVAPDAGFGVRETENGLQMLPLQTVTAAVTGRGLPQSTAVTVAYGSLGEQTATPGAEVSFTGLPLEDDAFAVKAPEGVLYKIQARDGGALIRLFAASALEGRVCDPDGAPLAGVTVLLDGATAVTGADGAYRFADLFPGTYTLSFALPRGWALCGPQEARVTLAGGETQTQDAVGMLPASLAGALREEGTPVAGVGVTLTPRDKRLEALETVTDEAGAFRFEGLLAGEYALALSTPPEMAVPNVPESVQVEHSGQKLSLSLEAVRAASVSGAVWHDEDDNGLRAAGEAGVSGARVALLDAAGITLASLTTGRDGRFAFARLLPGEYRVAVTLPEDMIFARGAQGVERLIADVDGGEGESEAFTLKSGEEKSGLLCGAVLSGSVSGVVWNDENGDGLRDAGEAPLSGARAALLQDGAILRETATDATGAYRFDNLRGGEYALRVTLPEGMLFTGGAVAGGDAERSHFRAADENEAEKTFSVRTWRTQQTLNAGGVTPGAVEACVFLDETADGVRQAREGGLSGAEIVLALVNGARETPLATGISGADGAVRFENVRPGLYRVHIAPPEGDWAFTAGTGDALATVAAGETARTGEMGLTRLGAVRGRVFADSNYDGLRGRDDPGVSATVLLLSDSGETVAQARADSAGAYAFEGVKAGRYAVRFLLPEGWRFTRENADAPSYNSDVAETAASEATTARMYLPMGETLLADAGAYRTASLSGLVWLDAEDSGVYPGAQAGLSGATATLLRAGEVVVTAETDENGRYAFAALPPGEYSLRMTLPQGCLAAEGAPQNEVETALTLKMGERASAPRIAAVYAATLTGTVRAEGSGLAGAELTLTGETGARTTVTDAAGHWVFADARPGAYVLTATLPEGWAFDGWQAQTREIRLAPREEKAFQDAALPEAAAQGCVWLDADGDGTAQGEEFLEGVRVTLNLLSDGETVPVCETQTDAQGRYRLGALPPGEYALTFGATDSTLRFGETDEFFLVAGECREADTAAWREASVSGNVWDDANADGVFWRGEDAVADAPVALLDGQGRVLLQTTTDENGAYRFDGVRPGTVSVRFTLPEECVFTQYSDTGSQVRLLDGNEGDAGPFALRSGEALRHVNAGSLRAGRVGDRVWLDENGNGLQDSGEAGVAGVTVTLLRAQDAGELEVARAQTDANGRYRFDGVRPGAYRVAFAWPEGYVTAAQMPDFPLIGSALPAGLLREGCTAIFSVRSGEAYLAADAGLVAQTETKPR